MKKRIDNTQPMSTVQPDDSYVHISATGEYDNYDTPTQVDRKHKSSMPMDMSWFWYCMSGGLILFLRSRWREISDRHTVVVALTTPHQGFHTNNTL